MPIFVIILIAALVLIGLVVWLLAEINADRKWQASIKPTVPEPLERLPPKSDC
jgi:Flp pilus assembly protein CpaB